MSTLTSGALALALLVCPALGAVPAHAADPADALTVEPATAAQSVEVGPLEIVQPTCTDGVASQQLTTDRHGVSTTVWACGSHVYASRTQQNGSWGDPLEIARGLDPIASSDRRGRVTVVVRQPQGDGGLATRRWAKGTWQPLVDLTFPTRAEWTFVDDYWIAVNPRGDTVVTWGQKNNEPVSEGRMIGIVAAFRAYDGAWGPSTVVVASKRWPDAVFVDGTGHASILDDSLIFHRGARGRWHDPVVAPIDVDVRGAVENTDGDLLLTGVDRTADAVVAFEKPAGLAWLPKVLVGTAPRPLAYTPVVLDGLGRAAVAYPGNDGSARVSTRAAQGAWTTAVALSPTRVGAGVIRLVRGPAGALAVSWLQGDAELWASIRPPGGDWSEPIRVTPPRWHDLWHPQVSFRPDGALVAAWSGLVRNLPEERVAARVLTPLAPRS